MLARRPLAAALGAVAFVGVAGVGAPPSPAQDRPFDHRRHESVSCRSCHGTGGQHRAIFIRTPRDCAACHHDTARAQQCTDCHSQEQLSAVRGSVVSLNLTVRTAASARTLPFGHSTHTRARVDCRQCHTVPVTLQRERACGSCHENHHRADANCSGCHVRPRDAAHPADAHLGCAAGGCHAEHVSTPDPAHSRNLCLVCHRGQSTHEPDKICAGCHKIPDAETASAMRAGGR